MLSFTKRDATNIRRNAANINQKDPISKIMPKKDIAEEEEKKAESNVANTTPTADKITAERGILTLPSENLATAQKITAIDRPTTRRRPLEVSSGMSVKGKKKSGNSTIVRNKET